MENIELKLSVCN